MHNVDKIIKNINYNSDEYIVVGVSAGPDSMALLDLLRKYLPVKIICAHVNHNIRTQSQEEELFLKEYCKSLNIIFECTKILKYETNNLENEARIKRYKFYEEILNKYHSHSLFLAHHGNDLIETVLMKIFRGSNLEGYAGIKTYSHLENYNIIRPLLPFTKEDILLYNKEHNIKYFLDKTNEDTKYTRNRIRKNILPLLKKEDYNIHLKFLKYSNTLTEYYDYIEDIAKDKLINIYKNHTIPIDIFNKEHNFMKKNIIFYILSEVYDNKDNIIKDKNIEDIIKLINNPSPNIKINLPHNIIARKEYNKVIIEKDKKAENYKIEFTDKFILNNIIIEKINNSNSYGNDTCRLNSKDISFPLYIRNRKNGDYIEVLGNNTKQKIKDIFIDKKIPKYLRDTYPLLVDSKDNILWIPNIKKTKYDVKNNEKCDIILTWSMESEENNEK